MERFVEEQMTVDKSTSTVEDDIHTLPRSSVMLVVVWSLTGRMASDGRIQEDAGLKADYHRARHEHGHEGVCRRR